MRHFFFSMKESKLGHACFFSLGDHNFPSLFVHQSLFSTAGLAGWHRRCGTKKRAKLSSQNKGTIFKTSKREWLLESQNRFLVGEDSIATLALLYFAHRCQRSFYNLVTCISGKSWMYCKHSTLPQYEKWYILLQFLEISTINGERIFGYN